MAVFYKNIDTVRSPISPEKNAEVVDTKSKLAELKAAIKWETDTAKRKELERKLSRMEKFDRLQEGTDIKDEKTKEDIQKILKWKNTETYSNSDLLTLRKKNIDIASLTLVNNQNADLEVKSNELKSGDSFTVNFGSNPSLRDRTGAGDILPPSVRNIKINGVECERKNTPRPGYYDAQWKYQKILDGYTIEIISIGTGNEDDAKANEKRWKNERLEDTIDNWWKALSDIQEDKLLQEEAGKEKKERTKYQKITFDINSIWSWDKGLFDFIAIAEWTWKNYNAIYSNWNQSSIDFTSMTLKEILDYQATYKIGKWSAAIGRYQFMDYTLKDMIKKYDISLDTVFSPETQDRLTFLKLNERWLESFKKWQLSKENFQMNLSREWASIAKDDSGFSYYHGDKMNNHASAAWKQIAGALDKLYA